MHNLPHGEARYTGKALEIASYLRFKCAQHGGSVEDLSLAHIAENAARNDTVTERYVRMTIRRLEADGFLKVERLSLGGHRCPIYHWLDRVNSSPLISPLEHQDFPPSSPLEASSLFITPSPKSPSPDINLTSTQRVNSEAVPVSLFETPPVESPIDDLFERFWKLYPRHVGKLAARKAFERALHSVSGADLLSAAAAYAADPNQPTDRGFIPHPATWLNQGRWDDEPLPAKQPPPQAKPQRPEFSTTVTAEESKVLALYRRRSG